MWTVLALCRYPRPARAWSAAPPPALPDCGSGWRSRCSSRCSSSASWRSRIDRGSWRASYPRGPAGDGNRAGMAAGRGVRRGLGSRRPYIMKWPRRGGILVHPTSLPSPYGIGDFGPGAIALLDFLHGGRQRLWQVLPLAPTGYGASPYAAVSAFAGNPLLISPQRLVEDGLLDAADLIDHPAFPAERVDYALVTPWKMSLLRRAHAAFLTAAGDALREAYTHFAAAQHDWLDDFALFAALKEEHGGVAWTDWPAALAARDEPALAQVRERLAGEIAFHRFAQFLFARQWSAVRAAARERGITILGDLAIFVAHDSADVWAHPQLFQLDAAGQPLAVAGVPPD